MIGNYFSLHAPEGDPIMRLSIPAPAVTHLVVLFLLLFASLSAHAGERCGAKISPEEVKVEEVLLISLVCDVEAFEEGSPVAAEELTADTEKKLGKLITKKAAKLGCRRVLRGPTEEKVEVENVSTLGGSSIASVEKRVQTACVGFAAGEAP
jgi:hypothetical protein